MPVIVITLTLTGIVWLTQSLRFVDLIVNKGLSVSTFIYLSLLLVPSLLFIVLPIAMVVSVLYIYNKLISDSELIVLKSAGLSRIKISIPALVVAGCISLVGYFISFYLLPTSYREFKETQDFIRNNYASVLLQEGVFSTPTKGLTVYIESRGENGLLEGIMVHDSRDEGSPTTMMAQQGRLIQTQFGPRFELINGNRQQIDKTKGNLSVLYFDSYALDLSVYTNVGEKRDYTPEERYINQLFFPNDPDPKVRRKMVAEGHYRVTWPLYSFVAAFIGLSALLSGQFNRRGQWKRIFSATIIFTIAVAISLGLKSVAVSKPFMAVFMYLDVMIIGGICWYIIFSNRVINGILIPDKILKAISKVKPSKVSK